MKVKMSKGCVLLKVDRFTLYNKVVEILRRTELKWGYEQPQNYNILVEGSEFELYNLIRKLSAELEEVLIVS